MGEYKGSAQEYIDNLETFAWWEGFRAALYMQQLKKIYTEAIKNTNDRKLLKTFKNALKIINGTIEDLSQPKQTFNNIRVERGIIAIFKEDGKKCDFTNVVEEAEKIVRNSKKDHQ